MNWLKSLSIKWAGVNAIMSFGFIQDNFGDIMTIFLQTTTFIIKIQDGGYFNVDPQNILDWD